MLPPIFKPATWHGVTNTDGKVIGISLNVEDGSVARYAVDVVGARHIAKSILSFLDDYEVRMNSQSDSSSGKPNVEGSPQDGQ